MSHKMQNQGAPPVHGGKFQRTPMRPMIAEYDPKKHGVKTELSDMVLVKLVYKQTPGIYIGLEQSALRVTIERKIDKMMYQFFNCVAVIQNE